MVERGVTSGILAISSNTKIEASFKSTDDRDSLLEESYSTEYSTFEIARPKTTSFPGRQRNAFPGDVSIDSPSVKPAGISRQGWTDSNESQQLLRTVANDGDPAPDAVPVKQEVAQYEVGEGASAEKEDMMRDDSDLESSYYCSVIPACAYYQWRCCRVCCCTWISTLLVAVVFVVGVSLAWIVQLFLLRSHISQTVDLATSGVYNVTSSFPQSNIYGSGLCVSFSQAEHDPVHTGELAYVSLISKACTDLRTTLRNETLVQNSALQYNSYMFHWHHGTQFSMAARVNGTSMVTIYLLKDRVSEMYCSKHLKPENIVDKWTLDIPTCYLNYRGYLDCRINYFINSTSTYYICINTTIYVMLSYNITISSVVYSTSASKTRLECVQGDSCCLPFDGLLSEIFHPTCMFISTQPLSPAFIGMELVNVNLEVGQRLSVFWYCSIALVVLIFILVSSLCLCRLTQYKVNHPDFNPRECTIHCSLYGVKN